MAEHDSQNQTERRRKRTIMSNGPPELPQLSNEDDSTDTDEQTMENTNAVPHMRHKSHSDSRLDELESKDSDYTTEEVKRLEKKVNVDKPSDVSDIVYDDTKPKRLSNPKNLKLDLDSQGSQTLQESISYLISPDEPDDTGSPTRRKRKQLHSVKSEPAIVNTRRQNNKSVTDNDTDKRSRRETVPERTTKQIDSNRLHYDRSPERAQRKVSSPVQRLMAKNSSLAAAAAANSKDRKSSTEGRLTNPDKSFVYNQPRRKISSDARLEHRYIDGQLMPPTSQAPKRKVSFDTSALINGSRVMPLNDEYTVQEVPGHISEEETEHEVNGEENKLEILDSLKRNIPRVVLTTDEEESFEQNDSDSKGILDESNSDLSAESEEGYASGCDNRGYIPDEDDYVEPKDTLNQDSYQGSNETRVRRLSPISDPTYRFDEAAVIPHTNIRMNYLSPSKKVSSSSLPSNIGRRVSSNDDHSPPKSILKVRREDAESINSEESVAVKNFKVRKDSIALFLDQHGTVAMQELKKEHSNRVKCFGKDDVKEFWGDRKQILGKYKLHLLVLSLFLLTFAFVVVGLHFHSEHHRKLATAQKVFFDAKPRVLTLSDIQNQDTLTGTLGLGIPSWKMPTHCYPNYKKIMDRTCLKWKEHGQLDIAYFIQNSTQCYNITWNLLPGTSAYDCYEIGGSNWYGPLNVTRSQWPIKAKEFSFTVGNSKHHGSGTFASAVEYYWLSSRGEAVVVDSDVPLEISWNKKKPGSFCAISKTSADFYGNKESMKMKFSYSVCNGMDIQTTHALIRQKFYPAVSSLPERDFLDNPHWSTVADSDSFRLNDTVVRNVAESIKRYKLNCSTIEIDGRWEAKFGDLTFDENAFNNISDLVLLFAKANCDISLNVYPFFSFHSTNFIEGMNNEYFVKDTGGTVPALLKWEHGVGAMLDVSNPAARSWYTNKILKLASKYDIDTFRLDYGSSAWVPKHPVFHLKSISPTKVKLMFSELMSSLGNVVVESTSQSQHLSALVGIASSVVPRAGQNCLRNIIPEILNLGLMGYPFILSDGFEIDEKHTGGNFIMPSRELFVRWMQLSSFLPAIRYTVKPWSYDAQVIEASRNLTKFHSGTILDIIMDSRDKILKGVPLIQPMWWNRSKDRTTFLIDDQFVLADTFLVAPILCERHLDDEDASRDIYVPKGVWRDVTNEMVVIGPRWLRGYKASQFQIPYFEKMPEYQD